LVQVKDFRLLQEDRVRQYHAWSEDHKRYLATGPPNYDLEMYKRCVKETTDKFQKTSQQIIAISREIESLIGGEKSDEKREIVGLIEKVQSLEQMKLRFTVDVQLAKQELQDDPSDQLMEKNLKGLQKRLNELTEEITETLEEIRYYVASNLQDDEEEEEASR